MRKQPLNIMRSNNACAIHARKTECPKCGGPYTTTLAKGRKRRRCLSCQREYHREYRRLAAAV